MNYEYYDHVAYYARVTVEPLDFEEMYTLDAQGNPYRLRRDMSRSHIHRYVEGDHRDTLEGVEFIKFIDTTPSGAHYKRALVLAAVTYEYDWPRDDEYKIVGYMSTRTPIGGERK